MSRPWVQDSPRRIDRVESYGQGLLVAAITPPVSLALSLCCGMAASQATATMADGSAPLHTTLRQPPNELLAVFDKNLDRIVAAFEEGSLVELRPNSIAVRTTSE